MINRKDIVEVDCTHLVPKLTEKQKLSLLIKYLRKLGFSNKQIRNKYS